MATTDAPAEPSRPRVEGNASPSNAEARVGGPASAGSTAAARPKVTQPKPTPKVTGARSNSILVNGCQRGNPIINHIRSVGWEYSDIVPDYQVGVASCVLFLSLRYHRLHPEYIHTRIQKLGQMYTLRILLVMCDVNDHQDAIKELTRVCLINNLTIMVAWTAEEAGRYLETYKAFETKPPDMIKERVSNDYMSHLTAALTSIKGVNKTDVITLASNFGSFRALSHASAEALSLCPGLGEVKVKRIRDAFSQPFKIGDTRPRKKRRKDDGSGRSGSESRQMRLSETFVSSGAISVTGEGGEGGRTGDQGKGKGKGKETRRVSKEATTNAGEDDLDAIEEFDDMPIISLEEEAEMARLMDGARPSDGASTGGDVSAQDPATQRGTVFSVTNREGGAGIRSRLESASQSAIGGADGGGEGGEEEEDEDEDEEAQLARAIAMSLAEGEATPGGPGVSDGASGEANHGATLEGDETELEGDEFDF